MKRKSLWVAILVIVMVIGFICSANAFTNIVTYGDSLSDTGNIGRFTDKDVWVETLADKLGSTLYNHAYAGATTGIDNPSVAAQDPNFENMLGLQWQVGAFQPGYAGLDDTLFTVWAGANDFFQARHFAQAAENVTAAVEAIAGSGAQDILVANLPDIGITPAFYDDAAGEGSSAIATGWTIGFNTLLEMLLCKFSLDNPDVNIYLVDVYDISMGLVERDADGNITNHDELFFDDVHPTSIGQNAVAAEAYRLVAPIPEPATVLLLATGLAGIGAMHRRSRRKI